MQRRLSAIMVADVVGYSTLMERDEADTLARLFALQAQLIEPAVADRSGRIIKTMGDGFLADFTSVVSAVDTAISIQNELSQWPDVGTPLQLRIGVHLGDVVVKDDDLYGDGVNVAARLEQAAEPGGVAISGSAYDQLAGHFMGEFIDEGQIELKNISRPIQVWRWRSSSNDARHVQLRPHTKPSIAVLPFDNLSGDPDQDFFADGMVEDLITMLSRFHWFRVITRSSSFEFRDQSMPMTEIGARLGARYLLQGSVRRAGERIRVSTQLVDTATATNIWADKFDRVMEDLFDLQDEIVEAIVGAAVPQFVSFVGRSRTPGQREDVSAWELAMRGWNVAWRADVSQPGLIDARDLFERALEVDRDSVLALSGLAFTYGNPLYQAGLRRDVPRALETAKRAVEIDDENAFAWCLLGAAETWNNDLESAERHLKRAIAINPSLALAHGYRAMISGWHGDVQSTDAWLLRMVELSPADRTLRFFGAAAAMARFNAGDYKGAVEKTEEVVAIAPELPTVWRLRAASLELIGDHQKAAEAASRLIELGPISIEWMRQNLTVFSGFETYLDALSRAGVPETMTETTDQS